MARATDKDFEAFGVDFKKLQSVALSNTVKKMIGDLDREIEQMVKSVFWFSGNVGKLAQREFSLRGARFYSAKLTYRFESVPLSKYPMKQIRITVGKKRLLVSRPSGKGKFSSRHTESYAIATEFKLRKSDGWRLVQGRTGFKHKGFLHTGKKGKFSSQVFERSQKATWSGRQRLPIHKLYGASLTWLLGTPELQKLFETTKVFDKFQRDYIKILNQMPKA